MALGAVKASCDSCFGPLGFGQARSPSGVARGLERVRGHVGDGYGVPGCARCGRRRRRRDLVSGRMRLRPKRTSDPDTKIAAREGPGARDGVPRTWVVGRLVLEHAGARARRRLSPQLMSTRRSPSLRVRPPG